MEKHNLIFSVDAPISVGKGALYISNGTYHELGRTIDQHELIFVRKGTLHVEEPDRSYDVVAGQTFILSPRVHHRCRETGNEPLQQYWARFSCQEVSEDSEDTKIVVPKLVTIARADQMLQFWRFYTDERKEEHPNQITLGLLLKLMLCEVANSKESDYTADTLSVLAAQARAFIQKHFHEPISRSSIAYALDCNPNYLGRAFNRAYGKTLTEYIYDVRLYYAREALAYERRSIGEVAQRCGFADRCHFRQVFVKRHGLSPLAYRKRYGDLDTNL